MAVEKNYDFTVPSEYIFDSNKVSVASGQAVLVLEDDIGLTFNQPFTNDTGFTYDSNKTEFSGGQVQQKNQAPTDSIFGVSYTTDEDANFGDDVLTGTLQNGAVVSGGRLDVTAGSTAACQYTGSNNNPVNAGAVKIKFTPNFSGSPASTGYLFSTNGVNQFYLSLTSASNLRLIVKNDAGGNAIDVQSGGLTWASGVEYEIEINFDVSGNVGNIYRDGTRIADETSFTGTRTSTGDTFVVGAYDSLIGGIDGYFADLLIFDTVQHTGTSYTPGYSVPDDLYLGDVITLPNFDYAAVGSIQQFTAFSTTEANAPRYVLNGEYWNGAAWVNSDDSYAQASSAADVNTNIATLTTTDILTIKVITQDGTSQMSVDDLTVTYTGQIYPTDNPTVIFNDTFRGEALESFTESATKLGSDEIKYTLTKGAVEYWYSSGWVISDGTYAQSNTAAEIETNKATFTTVGVTTQVKAFLHSDDGATTPTLSNVKVEYDFAGEAPDTIDKCTVWGYTKDNQGNVESKTITINLEPNIAQYKNYTTLYQETITITSDATTGYWEAELVETVNMPQGSRYVFDFGNDEIYYRFIPNESTKSFYDLVG